MVKLLARPTKRCPVEGSAKLRGQFPVGLSMERTRQTHLINRLASFGAIKPAKGLGGKCASRSMGRPKPALSVLALLSGFCILTNIFVARSLARVSLPNSRASATFARPLADSATGRKSRLINKEKQRTGQQQTDNKQQLARCCRAQRACRPCRARLLPSWSLSALWFVFGTVLNVIA